jgi:hypothetical protein
MSISSVRIALESKLNAMTPSLSTAYENVPFTPVTGTPYQMVFLLPATPANPTMGDGYYREQGIFQVTLMYPLQAGPKTAADRAELIRAAFKRGTSMTSGGITTIVERTPEIGQGRVDGDRWALPVKIRWYAGIY